MAGDTDKEIKAHGDTHKGEPKIAERDHTGKEHAHHNGTAVDEKKQNTPDQVAISNTHLMRFQIDQAVRGQKNDPDNKVTAHDMSEILKNSQGTGLHFEAVKDKPHTYQAVLNGEPYGSPIVMTSGGERVANRNHLIETEVPEAELAARAAKAKLAETGQDAAKNNPSPSAADIETLTTRVIAQDNELYTYPAAQKFGAIEPKGDVIGGEAFIGLVDRYYGQVTEGKVERPSLPVLNFSFLDNIKDKDGNPDPVAAAQAKAFLAAHPERVQDLLGYPHRYSSMLTTQDQLVATLEKEGPMHRSHDDAVKFAENAVTRTDGFTGDRTTLDVGQLARDTIAGKPIPEAEEEKVADTGEKNKYGAPLTALPKGWENQESVKGLQGVIASADPAYAETLRKDMPEGRDGVDGKFGWRSLEALNQYAKDRGIDLTGLDMSDPDNKVLQQLLANPPTLAQQEAQRKAEEAKKGKEPSAEDIKTAQNAVLGNLLDGVTGKEQGIIETTLVNAGGKEHPHVHKDAATDQKEFATLISGITDIGLLTKLAADMKAAGVVADSTQLSQADLRGPSSSPLDKSAGRDDGLAAL